VTMCEKCKQALDEYKKVAIPAFEEYKEIEGPAFAKYTSVRQQAWDKYEKATRANHPKEAREK
jgi:hypothetical protein